VHLYADAHTDLLHISHTNSVHPFFMSRNPYSCPVMYSVTFYKKTMASFSHTRVASYGGTGTILHHSILEIHVLYLSHINIFYSSFEMCF